MSTKQRKEGNHGTISIDDGVGKALLLGKKMDVLLEIALTCLAMIVINSIAHLFGLVRYCKNLIYCSKNNGRQKEYSIYLVIKMACNIICICANKASFDIYINFL